MDVTHLLTLILTTRMWYGNQTRVLEPVHMLTFIISMLLLSMPCLARSHM